MVVVFLYLTIVLSVLGHLSDTWCNYMLQILRLLIGSIYARSSPSPATTNDQQLIETLPRDIRGVRAVFNLEAKTITFATCPKCCCTYEPEVRGGISVYPSLCSFRPFLDSNPCGTRICKTRVRNGKSIRTPIRPFVMQIPESFIAAMLSRPGMEDALTRGMGPRQQEPYLEDIGDGHRVQTLQGPDGKPFLQGPKHELRLLWSFAVDWFNPFHNKAAGKSASVGSITLACLNLPPSLRYKPENLYLAGIIPGPREPNYDEINHFIGPLIHRFLPMWREGTWFSRTASYVRGRLCRSAIAALVCDLLGSRKVSGHAHPSMRFLCARCLLTQDSINDIDCSHWTRRTWDSILDAACAYKNATSQAERTKIFKQWGVRWTAFMDLPYWNNLLSVVVDGMHNLFLGLVSHHVRVIIGLDALGATGIQNDDSGRPVLVKTSALNKACREVLQGTVTSNQLTSLNIPTLIALHDELGVPLPPNFTSSTRGAKKTLVSSILVSPQSSRILTSTDSPNPDQVF